MSLNPNFQEKLSNIILINQDTNQPLGTFNNFDFYPGTISLLVISDFFNIKPEIDYILSLRVHFPNGESYPVHATRVNIARDLLILEKDGFGKATGSFQVNFTIPRPSDFYFEFTLLDPEGHPFDTFKSYHYFGKR